MSSSASSSYRERALNRINENNNESTDNVELLKELENSNKQIQTLQGNIAILNSQLEVQKKINIGLGVAYGILLLAVGIKLFLSKYKAKIRKHVIEELKNNNN
jgi:hypothetical protein